MFVAVIQMADVKLLIYSGPILKSFQYCTLHTPKKVLILLNLPKIHHGSISAIVGGKLSVSDPFTGLHFLIPFALNVPVVPVRRNIVRTIYNKPGMLYSFYHI